jgi:hypothetical protein
MSNIGGPVCLRLGETNGPRKPAMQLVVALSMTEIENNRYALTDGRNLALLVNC